MSTKKTGPLSYSAVVDLNKNQRPQVVNKMTPIHDNSNTHQSEIPALASESTSTATNGDPPVNHGDGFTPVRTNKNRKRSMKPLIIGSDESSGSLPNEDNGKPRLTGIERRQYIYAGRVSSETSSETVIDYVKSTWNISDVTCIQLAKNDDWCSFKIGVKENYIPKLLDASKWPKHVAILEFVHFPRNTSMGKRQNTGNFQTNDQTKGPA